MDIAVRCVLHYDVGCLLLCSMVVITLAGGYCSVLCFSLLCWMYIASDWLNVIVCFGCHYHVG